MGNKTLSESELIDNVANGSVTKMMIAQGDDKKFKIYVTLSWKRGELLLETQKKKTRAWSSLDRLVKHINTKYLGTIPIIELHLWRKLKK